MSSAADAVKKSIKRLVGASKFSNARTQMA